MTELSPRYVPSDIENHIYSNWEEKQLFKASASPDDKRDTYCIVIPPPNVTDKLHLGHALNNTLQDVLIRKSRMSGLNVLWQPGTDHAGIATQTIVEKRILANEGKRRTEFKREEFVARIQSWKDEFEAKILSQLKLMGCSCDWSRTRFTMDEVCAKAVRETFFRLFRDGVIYRGKRLVNWDPATQTVLADDEVEHKDVHGHFYYLKYPLVEPVTVAGERIEHITVATTRPETMLGDTAVAMNPSDPRAEALKDKKIRLPIVGREIPIILDDHVVLPDPNGDEKAKFSTGFLKVTPAHDPDDYAIGQRHNLAVINILAPDGTISDRHGWTDADTPESQNLVGMDRFEARKAVVDWFKDEDLLGEIKEYIHPVGHSYRSHVPIEPYLSDQWYIAVKRQIERMANQYGTGMIEGTDVPKNSLAGLALTPLLDGRVKFTPDRYGKTYQAWVENLRDWPISRQLWWGHQIPVWRIEVQPQTKEKLHGFDQLFPESEMQYKYFEHEFKRFAEYKNLGGQYSIAQHTGVDGEIIAYVCPQNKQSDAGLQSVLDEIKPLYKTAQQDTDVLDTWFSSALWPFSTLGWPDQTEELKKFYPGDTLCTAREIITLWVTRMVMMGQYCAGDIPFTNVFIHAMLQDGEGRKMSKSLGNGIDPIDIINSHGADAMRFTLALLTTQTQDVRIPVEQMKLPDGRTANTSSKFDIGRNFANKLWNAARFAMMNLDEKRSGIIDDISRLEFEDKWILSRREDVIGAVNYHLNNFQFSEAAQAIYEFTWHDFCDWYLEIIKPRLQLQHDTSDQARGVLALTLDTILRLLHPFMPFITEELWQHLNRVALVRGIGAIEKPAENIILAQWPYDINERKFDRGLQSEMTCVQEVIRAIRNIRSKSGLGGRDPLAAIVSTGDAAFRKAVEKNTSFIQHLSNLSKIEVGQGIARPKHSAVEVVGAAEIFVPLEGLIDVDAERAKLQKKLDDINRKLAAVRGKLSNEAFVSKAPANIIDREKANEADLSSQAAALEKNIAELK